MLQLLSCSIWVPLGPSHCRRGEQLPNSFCSQGTGALGSAHQASSQHLPRKDLLVSRDLHAGITHPDLTPHSLHSLSQPPRPSNRQGWGSVPTLISLFPLENMHVIWCPWVWRDWELLELSLLLLPLWGTYPPSTSPASVGEVKPSSAARGSQQVLLILHTMDAVLGSPLGTALCLQLSMTKGAWGARRTSRGVSQPLLPCESASSTPPVKGKGRGKEKGKCCRKALAFQAAGLTTGGRIDTGQDN